MGEKGASLIILIAIVVVIVAVAGVGTYFLIKGKPTVTSTKPLSAYAINTRDIPWLENLAENEVSGVFFPEFISASQLSEWGENGTYEKGIYQSNPNLNFTPGGDVAYQLIIRFKEVNGAMECYESAKPIFENFLARQFLTAGGRYDITLELVSTIMTEIIESENFAFTNAEDMGFIMNVRDNYLGPLNPFGGIFIVWLQHSNLVDGLIIAENYYLGWHFPIHVVPNITKNNALAIAQAAYNKMIS